MRNSMFTAFVAGLALLAPVAAEAKSYQGEGARMKHRSVTSRSHARSGGSSAGCLTSEARGLLGRIQARFGNVQIISTCRRGARIATTGRPSKHASGQAIDFRVPGRKREVVQWLQANHHSGGTMTYSDMDHIHVDVGYRFVALNRPSGH
ncbi:MAG: D-Ala-D-Ala carboxypeptidase family metallohydrolase [Hyphomicrobium sp.]